MCGFTTEELGIESTMWRCELWIDEHTALCYCLQWCRTLVREAKSNKQLQIQPSSVIYVNENGNGTIC